MRFRRKPPLRLTHATAYREAFERLDEALEKHTTLSHAEKLQLLGRQMFGDLWDGPEQNRTVSNPE